MPAPPPPAAPAPLQEILAPVPPLPALPARREPLPPPAPPAPPATAPRIVPIPPPPPGLRETESDVFGLWGQVHPDDLAGDTDELRDEDLPWLCPGDRLFSDRHGACRLLSLDDGRGRWRLRDEQGKELVLSSSELTAGFRFDEAED